MRHEDRSGLRERAAEVGALRDALARSQQGSGSVVLVSGAAGIGKSALLAAARDSAPAHRVFSARASELESTFPMGLVRQLLSPVVRDATSREREAWFEGAAALAEPVFTTTTAPDAEDPFPTLHGLHWLVANLARERPVLLLVDDAQWADDASLGFLGYLSRRIADLPVVLVVTLRPLGPRSGHLLAELVAQPDAVRLTPSPLSAAAVDELVVEQLGSRVPQPFLGACLEVTRGNPFLLTELLREVASQGLAPTEETAHRLGSLAPYGVAAVTTVRLARLPQACRGLAEAVAVLGDGVPVATAAALAEVDLDDAAAAIAQLVEAGLLVSDGVEVGFQHGLVRSTVAHGIGPAALGQRHRRAAELLRRSGAGDDQVAAHLIAAPPGGDPEAVAILRSAAAAAESLGAPASAAALLARAVAEQPAGAGGDPRVLVDLGRVEARAGLEGAELHLRQALEASAEDAALRRSAALELGRVLKFSGQLAPAIDVLTAVAGPAEGEPVDETAHLVDLELLGLAYTSVSARRTLADRRAALVEPSEAPASPVEAFALAGLAFDDAARGGSRDRTLGLVGRAVAGLPADADPSAGGYGFVMLTVACTWADHLTDALELTDRMVEHGRRHGRPVAVATGALMRALVGYHRGRLTEAAADAAMALELAPVLPGSHPLLTTAHAIAVLETVERATDGAELVELDREARLLPVDEDALPYVLVLHARGVLAAELGNHDTALELFRAAGDHATSWEASNPAVVPWRSAAALSLRLLGEPDEADRLVAEELRLARGYGAPRPIGIALRAAAALTTPTDAAPLLEEAVAVLQDSPSQLERARTLVDLGRAIRLSGRPRDAREPLRLALELAVHSGSNRLAGQAHEELLAAGVRPRRVAVTGVDALTPAERRVAELAAGGRSNRAIAEQLFISEKTVEGHLGKVYDKLGVRSRGQLHALIPA
ncbi:MAG TPA: AAA family ATPase [Nocardioides sp.]|nr:AAA family ATPase [Nocardioides sp.]